MRQLLLLCVVGVLARPAAAAPSWSGAVEVGYDRFAQVFRLTDSSLGDPSGASTTLRDTTDVFTELRLRAEGRARSWEGPRRYDLRLEASTGTDLDQARLELRYRERPESGRLRWDLDLRGEARRFTDEASFSLSQDNAGARGRLHPRLRVAPGWELGVEARGEILRYEGFTPYEYDQDRWSMAGSLDHDDGLFQMELRAGVAGRSVPDSTAIAWRGPFARAELFAPVGPQASLAAYGLVERRAFADPAVRSPYWDLVLDPDLRVGLGREWSLRLHTPQEYLLYDEDGELYQDTWMGRVGVEVARRWGDWEVGLQPRWSWQVSPWDTEDEYRQPSVQARVDLLGTGRLWFTFAGEVGWRLYETAPPGSPGLYSDYAFFRTTLLGTLRLGGSLGLDFFVSDEPQWAHRRSEDSRLTLYTLALRAAF